MMAPAATSEIGATAMRLGPKGRAVFTVKGWNDALRAAGIAAGMWWIANYAHLRWNAGYAQRALNYQPRSAAKRARMAKGEPPFFSNGTFQRSFMQNARTDVAAKRGGLTRFVIRGGPPLGLNFHPQVLAAFKRVPPAERTAVAREFRRALIRALMLQRAAQASAAAAKLRARADAKAARRSAAATRRADARANRAARRTASLRTAA